MSNDPSSAPSRRQFLGAAAGTAVTVATAGCLSSLVGTSSAATEIEPVEPSMPREGSPGEFYYFLEEHDIAVDELLREDNELYLTYRTEAETVEESNEEIWTVYQIYRQALIERGSEIEYLYTEITNPFDEQALGWGINSEWIHQANSDPDGNASADNESIDGDFVPIGNETNETATDDPAANETTGNESAGDELDMGEVMIWSNIMNSKVYEEDLEEDDNGNESEPEGDGKAGANASNEE